MTLYEIDQALLSLVDPETGELLDYESFAALQMEREKKLEGTALWIKDLEAEAKAIKDEADQLTKRRSVLERRAIRLRAYLSDALCGETFETPRCSIRYRKSSELDVIDAAKAADWLVQAGHVDLVSYVAPSLDKRGVKALIKAGIVVPECEVVEKKSMVVK